MQEYEDVIPIVFSVNDKYAPYLGVAIESLIQFSSEKYLYKIHILMTELSMYHKKRLGELKRENIQIEFIDVKDRISGRKIPTIRYLTIEATYRLLIDEIFPMYEKILYLDCDLIINKDVAELYKENIEGYIIGASRGRLVEPLVEYIKNDLKLSPEGYFNSGVLLINIRLFREHGIGKKCLDLLENADIRYDCMDQDVLNIICLNYVKFIDGHWNVEWGHLTGSGIKVVVDEFREGTLEYVKNPFIFHFTTEIKPWSHPETMFSEYFWRIARKSIFYEEILQLNNVTDNELLWETVKADSKIIIYGAGKVGRVFLNQITLSKYCEIIAVCDRKYKEIKDLPVSLISIDDIGMFEYDWIVIAIEDAQIAMDIKKELVEHKIDPLKIVWKDCSVKNDSRR